MRTIQFSKFSYLIALTIQHLTMKNLILEARRHLHPQEHLRAAGQDVIDEVVSIGEYVCVAGILVMLLFLDGVKWLDLVAGSSLLSVHEEWASRRWVFHGGFVSHCGWGSTVEGIVYGVPIIVVPMVLDQLLNAKIVADIGVGMEELARVIKQVVVQEEGQQIRRKPKELSESMKKKGDGKAINVVEKLM
ncbi:hypothetical protein KPL71_024549 [Citrus sinensis]|uniref:Uncharacterized protein n=1 Tax=Citrus sinensis TaxID=2711 RepID=A0ACB8ISH3_CITSI|nr:hypothetical protein KPL71_024549 [Citrus sinensis]